MWSGNDKKRLWSFGVITLGVPLLLLLPYFGFGSDPDVTLFSHVVVLLPALLQLSATGPSKGRTLSPNGFMHSLR